MEAGSKQPLILQLLKERRKFSELAVQLFQQKGVTAAVAANVKRKKRHRNAGAAPVTMAKLLLRRELLTQSEIDEIRVKVRRHFRGVSDSKGHGRAAEGGAGIFQLPPSRSC